VLALAAGVLALVAAAIVLAVVLTRGGSGSDTTVPANVTADLAPVAGIEQHGLALGNPQARVVLTEYIDTSCPICRDYVIGTFPTVSTNYIRTGKVRVEARPVAFVGPSSARGRQIVLAAARQDRAWQMLELLYENQGDETQEWLTDPLVRSLASKIGGLDVDRLLRDADSAAVQQQADELDTDMRDDGVNATPTFVLTTPDGTRHLLGSGNSPPEAFATAFDRALAS
jgi:protein-disulfide isomerase